MTNLEGLTSKLKEIIKYERETNEDIKYTDESNAKLLSQIIMNMGLKKENLDGSNEKPKAKMIYLGAPTGAGKDILVRKLRALEPDKKYVVLNMDIFRYYHSEITGEPDTILDKDYAKKTNQSSYEMYYLIQEAILKEFPGTNVIVTGTMKDIEWVKSIMRRYRDDSNTNYNVEMNALAVEKNESAFSIFERYLNLVDARDSSVRSLRFTDIGYHNATTKDFIKNVKVIEDNMNENEKDRLIDGIKVFRRNVDIFDRDEDTILYDSKLPEQYGTSCIPLIKEKMNNFALIDNERIERLINILKKNKRYLLSQGLYKDILNALREILISQLDSEQRKMFE